MNKGFIKLSLLFAGVLAFAGVVGFLVSARSAEATGNFWDCPQGQHFDWNKFQCVSDEPVCGTELTYVVTDESEPFNNFAVSVDIQNFSNDNDRRVVINPQGDYRLTFIGVDWTGNDNNEATPSVGDGVTTITYDAPNNESIDRVTVKLIKDCPQIDVCSNIDGTQTELPDGYKFESEGVCVEIVYGCTNPEATNYDPKANEDDQSCEFDHPVDVCSNIEGDQENVPDGYVAVEGECFPAETGGGDEPERGFIETSPAGAPTCDGVPFVKLPGNALVKRMGDDAIVQWQPTQGSEAVIYYREVGNPSNAHSLVNPVKNDGYEDDLHLLGSLDWEFGVQQKDGCAFSGIVWVIDGDTEYQQFDLPAYDVVTGEFLN